LNFELVPCVAKDCEEAGKYNVSIGQGTVQLCAFHALKAVSLREQNIDIEEKTND